MPYHTYPVGAIRLFFQFVMVAACSIRSSSAAMKLLGAMWSGLTRTPAANTGQLWLLRIGLYELTRPKELADDWCWIIDHTVQIGTTKCLLVAAIRLSVFKQLDRPLRHDDLQVIALEPVDTSDGMIVRDQLEAICKKGKSIPRLVLSDEGTDLASGYKAFRPLHPEVVICNDIAHLAAKFLRHELEADDRWGEFASAAGTSKQRLAQTPLAHLLPPTPRKKARYMNLDELVTWGERALSYLDHPHPIGGQAPDGTVLQAKLGWLADYRDALVEWQATMRVIEITCHYVRHHGYHADAATELAAELTDHHATPMSHRLATRLIDSVAEQSASARPAEKFVGSSECLESLIGKGKRLEGQQSQSGFTKMILGIPAAVVKLTDETIHQALATVKTIDVANWCLENLGMSVQAKRRLALGFAGTATG